MPKINVDSDYFDHPKTHRLKVYCGSEADIFPIRLWSFCAKYFPKEGVFSGYSASEIEGVAGWTGASGNLVMALERVGFLVKVNTEYQVKDWREHAGFIWNYKIAGRKGGEKSGISRRRNKRSDPSTLASSDPSTRGSTIELNGIELNKDSIEKHTSPPVDNSVDNLGNDKKPLTDVQKVVTAFKMLQGFERDDKSWDKMHFARFSKSAKQLVDFMGSWKDAVDCCQDVYEKLTSKGLTVTLETICKHSGDWKKDKMEKEASRGILSLPSNGSL